jgi:serine protease
LKPSKNQTMTRSHWFVAHWQRAIRVTLALTLCSSSLAILAAGSAETRQDVVTRSDEIPDSARVIVKFRSSADTLRRHALAANPSRRDALSTMQVRSNVLGARVGLALLARRALNEQSHVVTAKGMSSKALAALLSQDAEIEYAVVDQRRQRLTIPNDPLFLHGPPMQDTSGGPEVGQWYLRAPQGEMVSSINAAGAWDVTTGNPGVVVAVLDTGVRGEHPELHGRLLPGYDMVSDTAAGNDGDDRDNDASDPGDWVTDSESNDPFGAFYQCTVEDSSWHGTETSSLIGAATNDGVGMAGVAWGVKLLPVRVLGKCGGFDSDIIQAIRWAAGLSVPGLAHNPNPARVINMSLGGTGACTGAYLDAIVETAQMSSPPVIVAAAGNGTGHAVGTPANCPGVIAVAGLRHLGTKVGFSDLGPEISISAPGGNCVNVEVGQPCLYPILTATNLGTSTPLESIYSDAFKSSTGTSFSAPFVSGAVGLMLSVNPTLTPGEIKTILQQSARPFPQPPLNSDVPICRAPSRRDQLECHCTQTTCGAGMLDVAAAVKIVLESVLPNARIPLVPGWNLLGNGNSAAVELIPFLIHK